MVATNVHSLFIAIASSISYNVVGFVRKEHNEWKTHFFPAPSERGFGFAAQNQLYATLCSMVRKSSDSEAADETSKQLMRMRTPVYQADLATIENQFMQTVKDIKKEIGHNFAAVQAMIKEETEEMFNKLTKGQDIQNVHITPKEISTAVTDSVSGMEGVTPQSLKKLGESLTDFMESTLKQESGNEAPEQ